MNIGARLLLSAALAVGSTVGAAALGQTVVRDAQAELGQAAPSSIPAPAAPQGGAAADRGDADERAGADAAAASAAADGGAEADRGVGAAAVADAGSSAVIDAGSSTVVDTGSSAVVEATADVRADGVRAELAAAAAAGEISWDAAERVSDELGGYIRGDRVLDDIA